MPQGYNMQSSYNAQQQKGEVYRAPRVGEYAGLRGYNSQKGYVGVGLGNILQGYTTRKIGNYGESGYLFAKTPEVMGAFGGESFTTRRLNDLVGERVENEDFILPQTERKNPIQGSYEVGMGYKPQKEQERVTKQIDGQERDNVREDKEIDTKRLAELIEQELRQFPVANHQVHYV